MEKSKTCWVLVKYEEPVAVCATEADVQELFMDCAMEVSYENFCYYWLDNYGAMEWCLKNSRSLGGYDYYEVLDWR